MDDAHARELLQAERERLEKTLADLAPEDDGEVSDLETHPADDASETYDEERDEGLSDDLRVRLEAVERAEERLAAGTYGKSIDSGEPIPDARLEANPAAERTVAEQERFERSGG